MGFRQLGQTKKTGKRWKRGEQFLRWAPERLLIVQQDKIDQVDMAPKQDGMRPVVGTTKKTKAL